MFKILIGVPPKNHVNLAMDEVRGLSELGYECQTCTYTRNNPSLNKLNKLKGVILNAFAVSKHLKKFKPTILYLNSRFDKICTIRDAISIIIIRFLYRKKLVIVIKTHGSKVLEKSFLHDKLIIPYLTKNVDIWFFLSQEEKTNINRYVPKIGEKSYVTCNIIDPKRSVKSSDFLSNYGIDDSKFCFLFVGRMLDQKGIYSIIKSIPLFSKRDNCRFIFVGEGKDLETTKSLAKSLDVKKYVHFLGFIPEEECDHFYANVDALVFPSWEEGFAMALFKSVSAGLPIITTKIRAAKDQLKEPDNCLWVDIKSETSIASALIKLYENKALRVDMIKNNKLLGQNYSRQIVSNEMHNIFKKVASSI